jgi:hypothetical protein
MKLPRNQWVKPEFERKITTDIKNGKDLYPPVGFVFGDDVSNSRALSQNAKRCEKIYENRLKNFSTFAIMESCRN